MRNANSRWFVMWLNRPLTHHISNLVLYSTRVCTQSLHLWIRGEDKTLVSFMLLVWAFKFTCGVWKTWVLFDEKKIKLWSKCRVSGGLTVGEGSQINTVMTILRKSDKNSPILQHMLSLVTIVMDHYDLPSNSEMLMMYFFIAAPLNAEASHCAESAWLSYLQEFCHY